MAGVHATGGFALLFVSAAFVIGALVCTRLPGWFPGLTRARNALVALIGVEVALGGILYAQGRRPAESIHLLYGIVALLALPAAMTFAVEAPPKSKAGVLAVAGVVVCGLVWRLMATGDPS